MTATAIAYGPYQNLWPKVRTLAVPLPLIALQGLRACRPRHFGRVSAVSRELASEDLARVRRAEDGCEGRLVRETNVRGEEQPPIWSSHQLRFEPMRRGSDAASACALARKSCDRIPGSTVAG